MKYNIWAHMGGMDTSLPVRGAWIEIYDIYTADKDYLRRSPCGERGLKYSWRVA